MERFIWELRKKWKRMTGCSPPLKELGFSVDLAEMLSSVSYESYRRCMEEYEGQKEDDRIRIEEGGIMM
jgi:hypothetical protein